MFFCFCDLKFLVLPLHFLHLQILIMVEEEQQQQQDESLSIEHPRWIGGSILVNNFEDIYDLDQLINR